MSKKIKEEKKPASKEGAKELQQYVKPGFTLDDVIRLKECFDVFDFDKSGSISVDELKSTITGLGLENQAKKILQLVQVKGGEGNIDFPGFMNLFGFTDDLKSENSLQSLFEQFDTGKKGYITFEDFKAVCTSLGERYSDAEIKLMLEYADKDKDLRVSFDEFTKVVSREYPRL